jgi:RimJ/RimL family protein N-acetyltransferase
MNETFEKNLPHKISFQPLNQTHLNQLCKWLNNPHVKEWWNDNLTPEEIKIKYQQRINDPIVVSFIIYLDDKPLGFIQYYHADKVGDGWWPDETAGTVGIDQYIGETDYINKGYGTQIIRSFIEKLFSNPDIKKIIVDVDPNNHRAIRCYEKAGFKFVKEMNTPDGIAFIMETTLNF